MVARIKKQEKDKPGTKVNKEMRQPLEEGRGWNGVDKVGGRTSGVSVKDQTANISEFVGHV